MQAVKAVAEFNGTDLAGRKILVREDREDRDVKQYNKDNNIPAEERPERPPRRERRPPRERPAEANQNSSGLQACLPLRLFYHCSRYIGWAECLCV